MPHLTILVMDNCTLNTVWNFPTNTEDYQVYGKTIRGNPEPDTSTLNVAESLWGLIVFHYVYFSGVVSPGGPSMAVINCSAMPEHDTR